MKRLKRGTQVELEDKITGEIITGKVLVVDEDQKKVTIVTPDGQQKVINLLQFIVTILPFIDQIIQWFKGLFKKNRTT